MARSFGGKGVYPFIADFVCLRRRMIVEADGATRRESS
jgi:very-short-patch-repair endonuclease